MKAARAPGTGCDPDEVPSGRAGEPAVQGEAGEEPVVVPITGELDLHAFAPRDIASVVADYVEACRAAGVRELRLVHGRGRGVQRAVVRRVLLGLAGVTAVRDAPPASGGWGATLARLCDAEPCEKRENPRKTD